MDGKLWGVGVGPGDPELLTIKAVKIITQADVIALPGKVGEPCTAYEIAKSAVAELEEKQKLFVDMPMTKDKVILEEAHQKGAEAVMEYLCRGKTVAFLTLGDPTVYSTYIYIHKRIMESGFETEIVSGVPSFCAAAARMNISLAEKSEELHIIPATYQVESALQMPGTKVLMKSGKNLKYVKEQLKEHKMEAVMVENCGMDNEKIYYTVDEIDEEAGYFSLIIAKEQI